MCALYFFYISNEIRILSFRYLFIHAHFQCSFINLKFFLENKRKHITKEEKKQKRDSLEDLNWS